MSYKLYLFDFDYTLANSEQGIIMSYRDVLDRHGYTGVTDDDIRRTIGYPVPDSFTMMTGVIDPGSLEQYRREFKQKADRVMVDNTELYPSTVEVLEQLRERGYQTGIISTKFRYRIEDIIDKFQIAGLFDVVIGGEDVTAHKPDPQGILIATQRLETALLHVLYIGDTILDAMAAENAGVNFAAITTGTTMAAAFKAYPHVKIMKDLKELL